MRRVGSLRNASRALSLIGATGYDSWGDPIEPVLPPDWEFVGCSSRVVIRRRNGRVVYKAGRDGQNRMEAESCALMVSAGYEHALPATLYEFPNRKRFTTVIAMPFINGRRANDDEVGEVRKIRREVGELFGVRDMFFDNLRLRASDGKWFIVDAGISDSGGGS